MMSGRAATLDQAVSVVRGQAPAKASLFWALRRQFMLLDIFYLGFTGSLLVWALLSWCWPSLRLYETSPRFDWALKPHLTLITELALFFGIYLVLQRFAIVFQRDYYAQGRAAPLWLRLANLLYTFSPAVLAPTLFQGLGSFMAVVSGVPGVESHPAFDPAQNYDRAATYFDLALKQLDISLFGVYLPAWIRQFHTPGLSFVLFYCYIGYYICPFVAALPQIIRGNWQRARLATAMAIGSLLITYVLYILVPATGPRFEGSWSAWLPAESGWFWANEFSVFLDRQEIIRWDAFPSGHVATSITCLLVALIMHRRVGWAYLPLVAGLTVATIYFGYHYATDVLVGFACVAVCFAVVWPLAQWWERATNPPAPNWQTRL